MGKQKIEFISNEAAHNRLIDAFENPDEESLNDTTLMAIDPEETEIIIHESVREAVKESV